MLVNNLNIKLQVLVYSMVSSHQHEGKKIRCYNLKREKKNRLYMYNFNVINKYNNQPQFMPGDLDFSAKQT